jgi:hypothetical protein
MSSSLTIMNTWVHIVANQLGVMQVQQQVAEIRDFKQRLQR